MERPRPEGRGRRTCIHTVARPTRSTTPFEGDWSTCCGVPFVPNRDRPGRHCAMCAAPESVDEVLMRVEGEVFAVSLDELLERLLDLAGADR